MKNKLSKGLSLSVNPKHSISERFKASTRGFCHFLKKFESEWNTPFSVIFGHTLNISHFLNVILGFIPRIHAGHLLNVILGFIPRIHAGHLLNVILGLVPRIHAKHSPLLDTRVTPEYDNRRRVCFKPENDQNNLRPQCAPDTTGFLSDVYKRSTRAQKTHTLETAESGVDKVGSSCEKNPNVHKTYMNFLRQRKTALDAPLHAVSSGRSMIEMLGVLAIIGVLSVGGIAGYSKAMMKFKINKTMSQIAEIATNVRTLYAQQRDFNGLNNETAVQMGIVPDSLTTSVGRYYTTISNVFGGHVGIYKNLWRDERSFSVSFSGLPKEACIELATQNWGNATSSGIIGISVPDFSAGYDRLYIGCIGYEELYGVYAACSDSLPIPPSIAATYCQNEENSIILYYQ